jgi:hypothetical protein
MLQQCLIWTWQRVSWQCHSTSSVSQLAMLWKLVSWQCYGRASVDNVIMAPFAVSWQGGSTRCRQRVSFELGVPSIKNVTTNASFCNSWHAFGNNGNALLRVRQRVQCFGNIPAFSRVSN